MPFRFSEFVKRDNSGNPWVDAGKSTSSPRPTSASSYDFNPYQQVRPLPAATVDMRFEHQFTTTGLAGWTLGLSKSRDCLHLSGTLISLPTSSKPAIGTIVHLHPARNTRKQVIPPPEGSIPVIRDMRHSLMGHVLVLSRAE